MTQNSKQDNTLAEGYVYSVRRERAGEWRVYRKLFHLNHSVCVSVHTTKHGAVAACRKLNEGAK
jgi:hypothetical protein